MDQIEMIRFDWPVSKKHAYRKVKTIRSFTLAEWRLMKIEKNNPHKGFALLRLFKCLLLQFMEEHQRQGT